MKNFRSLFTPALFLAIWFAGATATLTQLAEMGGTLEAIDAREHAHQAEIATRQAAHAAMLEAQAATSPPTQSRRF